MSCFSLGSVLSRTVFIIFGLLISIAVQAGTFTNATTALTVPATSTGSHTVSFKTSAPGTHSLQEKKNSGNWVNVANYVTNTNGSATSYPTVTRNKSLSGRTPGTYSYRVKFVHGVNVAPYAGTFYSNIKITVVSTSPGLPSSISVPSSDNDGAFTVSWGAASGTVTSYELEQRVNSGSWVQLSNGTSLSETVSGLANGTYEHRVKACNSSGCSGYRTASNTTTVISPPGIPSSITITEL